MKNFLSILALNILLATAGVNAAQAQQAGFEKNGFYQAMKGDDANAVKQQLAVLKTTDAKQMTAFQGALMMKLAGIVSGLKKKLDLFKSGHSLLESVLQKDSSNTEYRFLRLMIQEHAPRILGYRDAIAKDKEYIKNNYRKLPAVVQDAIVDYSKKSKVLTVDELL
jgi:hypothetical protein